MLVSGEVYLIFFFPIFLPPHPRVILKCHAGCHSPLRDRQKEGAPPDCYGPEASALTKSLPLTGAGDFFGRGEGRCYCGWVYAWEKHDMFFGCVVFFLVCAVMKNGLFFGCFLGAVQS